MVILDVSVECISFQKDKKNMFKKKIPKNKRDKIIVNCEEKTTKHKS